MKLRYLPFTFLLVLLGNPCFGQYDYEPNKASPFGKPNPDAPVQIKDWSLIIGEHSCLSLKRIDRDNWADTLNMIWRFKYIMNGTAVQDETLHEDGAHAGSIRQYIADSAHWYVHFYSNKGPTPTLPAWEGNLNQDGEMVLYRDQKAPNGMEGDYQIIFSNMTGNGFDWLGAWVPKDRSFAYPTWKIWCEKKK